MLAGGEKPTMAMARRGRAVVPLLGALTALALVVAGVAITLQMKERTARLAKEREVVLLKAENQELQGKVDELKTAKQQAEEKFTHAKDDLEQVTQQLAQERQEREGLTKAVDDRQHEIDRLSKDMEQLRTDRTSLNDQLAKVKSQQQSIQQQLSDVQQEKAQLEAKAAEQQTAQQPSVNLDTVVVSGTTGAVSPAAGVSDTGFKATPTSGRVQGQVVVVNRDYDFVVMNLGRNQGVEIGQEYQITRGQDVLGRVKVEKVYDELAAATILPESKKDTIREGDALNAI